MKQLLLFFALGYFCFFSFENSNEKKVVGTYTSRTATSLEAITLMYSKGYFPYLEIPDNYIKLKIERDSTFQFTIHNKEHSGKWKVDGRTLILDYTDVSNDDLELKIRNNKLYNISEATLCKSKKKMMRLMLLEKNRPIKHVGL